MPLPRQVWTQKWIKVLPFLWTWKPVVFHCHPTYDILPHQVLIWNDDNGERSALLTSLPLCFPCPVQMIALVMMAIGVYARMMKHAGKRSSIHRIQSVPTFSVSGLTWEYRISRHLLAVALSFHKAVLNRHACSREEAHSTFQVNTGSFQSVLFMIPTVQEMSDMQRLHDGSPSRAWFYFFPWWWPSEICVCPCFPAVVGTKCPLKA